MAALARRRAEMDGFLELGPAPVAVSWARRAAVAGVVSWDLREAGFLVGLPAVLLVELRGPAEPARGAVVLVVVKGGWEPGCDFGELRVGAVPPGPREDWRREEDWDGRLRRRRLEGSMGCGPREESRAERWERSDGVGGCPVGVVEMAGEWGRDVADDGWTRRASAELAMVVEGAALIGMG